MQLFNNPQAMQDFALNHKRQGRTIGLVPTMGYLHAGHLSLVKLARSQNDVVIVSVFVNPTQFGEGEDFEDYPRNLEQDLERLQAENVDACLAPTPVDMYPPDFSSQVLVNGEITAKLCGRSRPVHFQGVTTVVSKLFHICQPDRAYFGQKDAQQASVIEKMVRELNFPVTIVRGPIIRENDGLAMSSRNVYLTPAERQEATALSRSLQHARELITAGERDPQAIIQAVADVIRRETSGKIDYIEVVQAYDLRTLTRLEGRVLIAMAIKFSQARLLDNMIVEVGA